MPSHWKNLRLIVSVCGVMAFCGLSDPLRGQSSDDTPANAKIVVNTNLSAPPPGDARFGVMTHFAQGWNPDWSTAIVDGGIARVRDEVYWKDVEPEKGVFKFPPLFDIYLNTLKRNKISPLLVLSFENPLYDDGNTPYTQEGFDAYARYAVEVLRHYGDQVKAVEIWNEYNGSFNRGPASANRAATYVQMLRTAYVAIKRERPDVTVLGGSTIGIPMAYWEKILSGGGAQFMDAMSVHPYRYSTPPEGIESDIADFQRLIRQYNNGADKPVWVTEIGWPIKPSVAPGDLLVDEAVQAKFLVRVYALLLSGGVDHVYWYLLRDYQEFTMGLVRDEAERTRKPAYFAYATLIRQLQGAHFVRRETTLDDLYSLLFQMANGDELRILWSLNPRRLQLTGATSAATIEDKPMALNAPVDLGDSPLFVSGPLRSLPPPVAGALVVADSKRDFGSSTTSPWTYGAFVGDTTAFSPLPNYELTDWNAVWTGTYPYISISSESQHPSNYDNKPVAAVRRWTSNYDGRVRITGNFRCGTDGDGVGVSVTVDGQRRFRKLLGSATAVAENFELVETVHSGTTIDFAVDPGPAGSIDYDSTAFTTVIRAEP